MLFTRLFKYSVLAAISFLTLSTEQAVAQNAIIGCQDSTGVYNGGLVYPCLVDPTNGFLETTGGASAGIFSKNQLYTAETTSWANWMSWKQYLDVGAGDASGLTIVGILGRNYAQTGIGVTPTIASFDFDASGDSIAIMGVTNYNRIFNGATWDRWRGSVTQGAAVAIDPLPLNAITITNASGNVANASAVASLGATAGLTTYITGFEVTSSGATIGAVVTVTVTGILGGTLSYTYAAPVGVLVMGTPLIVEFTTPLAASSTGVGIAVTLPALGAGNTNATVVAHGFKK